MVQTTSPEESAVRADLSEALLAAGYSGDDVSEAVMETVERMPGGFICLVWDADNEEWYVTRFLVRSGPGEWQAEPEWAGADKQDGWRYLVATAEAATMAAAGGGL